MTTELTASHGPVEGRKEAVVKDLKRLVVDADDLVKEMANTTVEAFSAARTKIEGRMDDAKSRLDDARVALTQNARGAADATQDYVSENPWKLLAVAAAVGVIVGFVFSRR